MNKKRVRALKNKEQNGRCYWCGYHMKQITIDHLVPISLGGNNRDENLVVSCQRCNSRKDNSLPDAYIRKELLKVKDFMESDGFKRYALGHD